MRERAGLRLVRESTHLDYAKDRLEPGRLRAPLERRSRQLDALAATVRAFDPQRVLERGYALALDGRGEAVKTVAGVKPGDAIELRVSDGRIDVTVDRVEKSSATPSHEEKP